MTGAARALRRCAAEMEHDHVYERGFMLLRCYAAETELDHVDERRGFKMAAGRAECDDAATLNAMTTKSVA